MLGEKNVDNRIYKKYLAEQKEKDEKVQYLKLKQKFEGKQRWSMTYQTVAQNEP